ncbi:MAG: hypothetical protein WD906_02255 [Anaerolineales bacterium]
MSEPRITSGHRYMTILAIAFSPGLIGTYGLLLPMHLCAGAARPIPSLEQLPSSLPDWVMIAALGLVPAVAVACALPLASAARSWPRRAAALYSAWLILGLAMALLLAVSLAGASMAVAEGATSGWDLKLQEFQFALSLLVPMQVVIIPWVAVATFLLNRLFPFPASAGT